jgi:hypothetical protein
MFQLAAWHTYKLRTYIDRRTTHVSRLCTYTDISIYLTIDAQTWIIENKSNYFPHMYTNGHAGARMSGGQRASWCLGRLLRPIISYDFLPNTLQQQRAAQCRAPSIAVWFPPATAACGAMLCPRPLLRNFLRNRRDAVPRPLLRLVPLRRPATPSFAALDGPRDRAHLGQVGFSCCHVPAAHIWHMRERQEKRR